MNADEEQTSSLKLIGKSVLYVALAVAIFLGTFQVVKFAAGTETPLLVVVSRSMEPTLRVGDLVIIRHFDPDELVVPMHVLVKVADKLEEELTGTDIW